MDDFITAVSKGANAIVLFAVGVGVLIIGLQDLPYVYYQALRWVVCTLSIYTAVRYFNKKGSYNYYRLLGWLFIIPAILFNPIAPFYLDKSAWIWIDIIVANLFTWTAVYEVSEEDIISF